MTAQEAIARLNERIGNEQKVDGWFCYDDEDGTVKGMCQTVEQTSRDSFFFAKYRFDNKIQMWTFILGESCLVTKKMLEAIQAIR